MPDFTVVKVGEDSSGRPLYMTRYMRDWWNNICRELGFRPTIVQGAFMARAGGGASASAGYHDGAGCLDLRTWDRSADDIGRIIRMTRRWGAGSWVRDHRHGMDPHIHLVLGSDRPLDSGAAWQWSEYLAGRDGLASRGKDYHWRPDPIVKTPPKEDRMNKEQDERLKRVEKDVNQLRERLDVFFKSERERDREEAKRDAAALKRLRILLGRTKGGTVSVAELEQALSEHSE